ncbi:hypothetical protein ACJX0J_035573 [Zea mays]
MIKLNKDVAMQLDFSSENYKCTFLQKAPTITFLIVLTLTPFPLINAGRKGAYHHRLRNGNYKDGKSKVLISMISILRFFFQKPVVDMICRGGPGSTNAFGLYGIHINNHLPILEEGNGIMKQSKESTSRFLYLL